MRVVRDPQVELRDGRRRRVQPQVEAAHLDALLGLRRQLLVQLGEVGQGAVGVLREGSHRGALQARVDLQRIDLQGLVDVLHGLVRLLQLQPDLAALREEGGRGRRERAGAVEVGQGARVVATRGRCGAAPRVVVGAQRRIVGRSGRRHGRRRCDRVVHEHAPAVVGEEHHAALLGHVDVVRQEEVDAQQHVLGHVVVGHAQAVVGDDLAAQVDRRERRRPGLHGLAIEPVADAAGLHVAVRHARLVRRPERHQGAVGAGVEQREQLLAVDLDQAADLRQLEPVVVVTQQVDLGDRRVAGPVGHVRVAAVAVREDETDHAVGEVVLGIGGRQDVAAQDAHGARAGFGAADDEVHVGNAAAQQFQLAHAGRVGRDIAAQPLDDKVARHRHEAQVQLRRGGVREHAVERPAVHHQRHARAVDAHRGDGARADHRHRQLRGLEAALRVRGRRQQQRERGKHARQA